MNNAEARARVANTMSGQCPLCDDPLVFTHEDSCPNCGLLWVRCRTCSFSVWWGE